MRHLATLIVLPLLAAALPAQTYPTLVSPRLYEKVDATGQNAFPFSGSNQFSYQQLHDDLVGRPRFIHELAFRINLNTTCSARTMNLTLKLTTSPNTSATASNTFANNLGPDVKTVISKTTFNWPAQTATPQVAPFDFKLPFWSSPFLYKGIGTLCWEVRIHTNTQTSYVMHDAVSTRSHNLNGTFGTGCIRKGATLPAALTATLTAGAATNTLACSGSNLPASQPAIWYLGTNVTRWGTFPLPLDLTPLGAAGCELCCSIALLFTGSTTGGGTLALKTALPQSPLLAGMPIYTQAAALDPGRGALPMVFTNGTMNAYTPSTGNPYGSRRIYGRGSDTATTGTLSPDYPLVTRFGYR